LSYKWQEILSELTLPHVLKEFLMGPEALHQTIEIELTSRTEGPSDHPHETLSTRLPKSMEQKKGKTSGTLDYPKTVKSIDGIAIGRLVEGGALSGVWVDYPDNPSGRPLIALSTVAVSEKDIGREVALAFETGNPTRPILLGFIHKPQISHAKDKMHHTSTAVDTANAVNVQLDGEQLILTGDKEIVLRCGKASITLTRAGKVLIRGTYLLNRSSGVNRIVGGSVQLN
jgi:hypothetical protein